MKISITRTGGFAGTQKYFLDTAQLEPNEAAGIEKRVQSSGLLSHSSDPGASSIGADIQECEVTIEDGNQRRRAVFTEDGAAGTAPLTSVVNEIVSLSHPR